MQQTHTNAGTPRTGFTGANGIRGCQQAEGIPLDCVPVIPLENTGGPGTADAHWRKSIFGNELMTAFLSTTGAPAPLSAMTVGSITDLGYQTNSYIADAYMIPSAVVAASSQLQRALRLGRSEIREVILKPRFQVSRNGVTAVVP